MKKFLSKLFQSKAKEDAPEKKPYAGNLSFILVYREFEDTEEQLEKWFEENDDSELFAFESFGESGPSSFEDAKKLGMPVYFSHNYPIYFVYDFISNPRDYSRPLMYSTDIEEVKRYIRQYEATFKLDA